MPAEAPRSLWGVQTVALPIGMHVRMGLRWSARRRHRLVNRRTVAMTMDVTTDAVLASASVPVGEVL